MKLPSPPPRAILASWLAAALTACAPDGSSPADGGPSADAARYAIASTVSSAEGATTYVTLLDGLESQGELDLAKAREHPGWATIGATDGMLFVGDGESPVLTRYQVGDDGALSEDGTLSFADYGLPTAALYSNIFVDGTTAYMNLEVLERIVWDPTGLEIEGVVGTPGLAADQDGLLVRSSFDRGAAVRDGYVFQPYYWSDADYYRFHPSSQIAVYDQADDSVVELIDAPCPGLDVVTRDEDGALYFSNWVFPVAAPLLDESQPSPCVVRIPPGQRALDDNFTRDLKAITDGRQTAAFRYVGDGTGLVAVLHHERVEIDDETLPAELHSGNNWRLWRIDLDAGTGAPVEGLDFFAGGYYAFQLEERTLLLLPTADYSSTVGYEITEEGGAEERFRVSGWAYQLVSLD